MQTSLRLTGVPRALAEPRSRSEADERPRRSLIRVSPRAGRVLFGVGAGLLLFYFVAPIIWIIVTSLQTDEALSHMPPHLSITNLWLDGYTRIIQDGQWQGSLVVSLLTAVLTTLFVIVLASPAAYALARFQLTGKRAVLAVLIFMQMVPAIVMAIPVLKIFQILGLTDTVAALVIVNVAFWLPLVTWLLRNFFSEVPVALERAARIDGCSRLGTLFRVTVPAARPGIAAASILILIGTWNEFLFAVILGNRNAVTITRLVTVITSFPFRLNESPPPDLLAAGGIVAVIPCLVLSCCSIAASSPASPRGWSRGRHEPRASRGGSHRAGPKAHDLASGGRDWRVTAIEVDRDRTARRAREVRLFATFAGGYSRKPLPAQPDLLGDAERRLLEGDLDADGFRAVADEFVREILGEMAVVELGIVGEGGVRAHDRIIPWIRGLEGLAAGDHTTLPDGEPATRPIAQDTVLWTRPVTVRDWQFAAGQTDLPVKQTMVGPYSLAALAETDPKGRADLAVQLGEALNLEILALAAAGCPMVEIDEPITLQIGEDIAEFRAFRAANERLFAGLESDDGPHLSLGLWGGQID